MVKEPVFSTNPILITGSHRSGTTWAGTILSTAPRTVLIREPFNPLHRPGIFNAHIPLWYQYVDNHLGADFIDAYRDMLSFRYGYYREIGHLSSFKDAGRMIRDSVEMSRARVGGYRPIIKDPLALFSTNWIIDQFQAKAVILVRHPAAFVSSLKRVQWKFSFRNFAAQPELMDTYLAPFQGEIEMAVNNPPDFISRGALLWKILYSVVNERFSSNPSARVVRHEDLSLAPLEQYEALFDWLELPFTGKVAEKIIAYSSSFNPKEARGDKVFELKRDSAANINNWKERLTPDEINTVFRITSPLLELYYPDMSPEESITRGDDS